MRVYMPYISPKPGLCQALLLNQCASLRLMRRQTLSVNTSLAIWQRGLRRGRSKLNINWLGCCPGPKLEWERRRMVEAVGIGFHSQHMTWPLFPLVFFIAYNACIHSFRRIRKRSKFLEGNIFCLVLWKRKRKKCRYRIKKWVNTKR